MKRLMTLCLCLCLCLLVPFGALAADAEYTKEEVVYASLDSLGAPRALYAVNIFNLASAVTVKDKGEYSSLKNLTDLAQINYENGVVSVDTTSKRFYYQGNMKGLELPWNIAVTYKLNGENAAPETLAGADGHVEITLDVTKNEAVSSEYFDNLLCQITLTLATEKCENILAPGATIANVGGDKSVSIMALPGQGAHAVVSFDAKDFSMDGLTVAALPFSITLAAPDLSEFTAQLDKLSAAISSISSGVSAFSGNLNTLAVGASSLSSGISTALDALNASKDSDTLAAAASAIKDAIAQADAQIRALPTQNDGTAAALAALEAAAQNAEKLVGAQTAVLAFPALKENAAALATGLDEAAKNMNTLKISTNALNTMTQNLPAQVETTVASLLASYDYSSYVPTSFVSTDNGKLASIQFVMTTDPIKKPAQAAEETTTESGDFWTRLKKLFE